MLVKKIIFLGKKVKGEYALVESKVVLPNTNMEFPVNYRLFRKGNEWSVYDVTIEGVSLVRNYRSQFNDIMIHSSFGELIKRLREKVRLSAEWE